MSIIRLIESWNEVRAGLITEASQVPGAQFSFRATPKTRSVAELLQHIIAAQKLLVGEACRAKTNLRRQSFADHVREHAPEVAAVTDKEGLLELLRVSMKTSEASINRCGERLREGIQLFDGKEISRLEFLNFAMAHEVYHRGQLTVYQRLMDVEPSLTQHFKQQRFVTAASGWSGY